MIYLYNKHRFYQKADAKNIHDNQRKKQSNRTQKRHGNY